MKALIIEDEAPAGRRLKKIIEEIDPGFKILDVIDSIESSVKWLKNHHMPDMIFMDIQLADGLSFAIFDQVEIQAPVIFTTAYDEYTLKAFKVNSIDYLLKPIDKEELKVSIRKFEQLKNQFAQVPSPNLETLLKSLHLDKKEHKSRFLVRLGERLVSVPEHEIAYLYAEQKIVLLITNQNEKYAVDYSLDELEALLNPEVFFRLNRQFLARVQSIGSIYHYFKGKLKVKLLPEINQEVIVSREKSPFFKQWLDR
ncbi:MAG: response regulator transcription factor [Bacteroidia bacterium]|nr:response regulator transcription factor [Saprospiraceae bacterium]NJO00258.1 response regulator transcription factor [Bacteroidia bacterium]